MSDGGFDFAPIPTGTTRRHAAAPPRKPQKERSLVAMLLWMIGGVQVLGGAMFAYHVGVPLGGIAWIPFAAAAVGTWGFAVMGLGSVVDLLTQIRDRN